MKAQELLIHLGHSKTGTSELQRTFQQSRAALQQQDIFYPDIYPHSGNGIILGYHLLGDQTDDAARAHWLKISYPQARELSLSEWIKIVKSVQERQPKTLLLSSESFFNLIRPQSLERFEELTNDVAETKTAIAYLRAPHDYYLSSLQQQMKKVRLPKVLSRYRIRNRIEPLCDGWSGKVQLHVFDRVNLIDGDIVADFAAKHLPNFDQRNLTRSANSANTSLSAEAMALLHDCNHGRLVDGIAPQTLIDQVMKADRVIPQPTKPKLLPNVAETLINWSAPDLFWLRDTKNIVFPNIDYDAIKVDQTVKESVSHDRVEEICRVDPDRKALVYARAAKRAKLPPIVRRWMSKW